MEECRHIRVNGTKCQSAALRGQAWCYYHDEVYRIHAKQHAQRRKKLRLHPPPPATLALRDSLSTTESYDYGYSPANALEIPPAASSIPLSAPLELPDIEDISSIQLAISRILHALAANTIDHKRAGLLLYGLQIAAQNQPRGNLTVFNTVREVGQTCNGIDVALAAPGKVSKESFEKMANRLGLTECTGDTIAGQG